MPISRTCAISRKEFEVSDKEIALLEKISPVIGWERFFIPLPTLCPGERQRRRMHFKNYLNLFKRPDDITGISLISIYPPDSPYTVYSQPYWWSDGWEPKKYAKDIDLAKSIFEQIYEVFLRVPVIALDNAYTELENSEYINGNGKSKDCYLISNGNNNEKCLYCWSVFQSSNILNANYVIECENCSNSQHIWRCYDIHHSWDTSSSRNSRYLFSCEWCEYVLGGVHLLNQKYQILNTPCTENEFQITLEKLKRDISFRKDFEKKVQNLIKNKLVDRPIMTWSIDSSGDFCYDSKDALECYNIWNCESVAYITESFGVQDSMDINKWWENIILSYDNITIGRNASNMYWNISCWWDASYNFYSYNSIWCSYIFGCSGLRNQSYCIFNKQYTKEIWENEMKKIITKMKAEWTWWEFLDPQYSFFAYDESHAMEQMPLSRDEAHTRWLRWSDRSEIPPEGITKIIPWELLPESVENIPDDILHWAIRCTKTGKLFQIQPLELDILRRYHIPIPRIHPVERIKMRLKWDSRVFDFDF